MAQVLEDPVFIRENDQIIFAAMKELVCADRAMLCARTTLARTTVYDGCNRLVRQGVIHKETEKITPGNGTPSTIYMLDSKYGNLTPKEWRRLVTKILGVYRFFCALTPEQWIFCAIRGGLVRYGQVEDFCKRRCGVRIQCPKDNQDGVKHER